MSKRIKIKYTIRQLADELAVERDTLYRRFNRLDIPLDGLTFLRDIVRSVADDRAIAMVRKLETEISLNEIEIREKNGQLCEIEEVKVALLEVLQSLKRSCFKLARENELNPQMENIWTEFNHSLCETLAAFLDMRSHINSMDAAIKQSDVSDASFKKDEGKLQGRMGKLISKLSDSGRLVGPDAQEIERRVSAGGMDNLIVAQKLLRKMFPSGIHDLPAQIPQGAIGPQGNPDQRWDADTMQLLRVRAQLNSLAPGTKIYKEKLAQYQKLLKQQGDDGRGISKWTSDLKRAQGEQASLTGELQEQDRVFPTIGDLSRVNSRQGAMARQYLGLQKDQTARRLRGDVVGANWDASAMTNIRGNPS